MNRSLVIAGAIAAAILVALANALYIVRVDQQAIILQFGEAQGVVNSTATAPGVKKYAGGLNFKVPFVQSIRRYDKRILGFDLPQTEIIAADQQRLIVDAIVRYRIKDPLQFFRRAPATMANGETQLRQRLEAALLGRLGKVRTPDIISGQRAKLMQEVKVDLATGMAALGVEIIDVRIRRADYPPANSAKVYERMMSELQQKAKQYRAEGEEQFLTIQGDADKQAQVILADAQQRAQKLRGEGDATRNAIYADAYGRDPEFFAFYRSLQAYESSIKEGTPIVLSPDSEFFKYFKDSRAR